MSKIIDIISNVDTGSVLADNALTISGHEITLHKADGTSETIALTGDEAVWRGIVDVLTSDSATESLSAAQGKILKGYIDNINTILTSDDTTLDQLQEIVDYIKQNKDNLDTLSVPNIAGLQDALDGKLGSTAQAADSLKLAGNESSYFIHSDTAPVSGSTPVNNIIKCTQDQYDAITPDDNTFYIIVD